MRVLSVGNRYPPWSIGGYEAIWADAVEALRACGHEVRVLTTRPDPSDRDGGGCAEDVHRELRWYWRDHRFPPLSLRAAVALERANAAALGRHLREFAPDAVLWLAMGGMSLSLLEHARRAGVPALGVVADDWLNYGPRVDGWLSRVAGWRVAAGWGLGVPARVDLDRVARWLFISDELRRSAAAGGRHPASWAVLHRGIDPARFPASPPTPWAWRLLHCGRLDPRKGVDTAVRALARLPAEATLTLHGDGEAGYVRELRRLGEELGVSGRLRWSSGGQEGLARLYADADAVIFPVRWREPWGLVPLEAMAVGRPLLAAHAGGGPDEYLREGENCLRFEPGDEAALAELVRRLAAEEPLRDHLRAGGAQTVARLDVRHFHAGLERELQQLVGG